MFERLRYPYGLFRCYLAYAYTEYHSAIPRAGVARNRLRPPSATGQHGQATEKRRQDREEAYRGAAAVATAA